MPLQEPVVRSVSLSFGWALPPRFPDVRGRLTELLIAAIEAGTNWTWGAIEDEPSVVASNDERRLHAAVRARGLDIVSEHPDTTALAGVASTCVEQCLSLLGLNELQRVGASVSWTLAAGQVDQAEAAFEAWLFSPRLRTRFGAIGGRPDDLVLTARFETDQSVVTVLRAEPLTDEQAANGPFFLSDLEASEFPPAALFVRLDRDQQQSVGGPNGIERSIGYLQQVLSHGEKLLATVRAEDDLQPDPSSQERQER